MRARVYVTYHKGTHVVNGEILEALQVGPGPALEGCRNRDNTGRNIADRNDQYCEMTAAYWAWQNTIGELDYVGLLHYRRFLDFTATENRLDCWGVMNWPCFTTDFVTHFGLEDACIRNVLQTCDIVLPRRWSVRQAGFRSLEEHYASAPHHHREDLLRCRAVVAEQQPSYLTSWDRVLKADCGWFNNMFVIRTDIYDAYCTWLFPLLAELERRIPLQSYGLQERRVLGYLAERLFNVWLQQRLESNEKWVVREFDRVFVQDPSAKIWDPKPQKRAIETDLTAAAAISVVVACDNAYVPHLGALVSSIIDNLSPGRALELLILDGGISTDNQTMLKRLLGHRGSLHFIPMEHEFTSFFTHMHFSRATFYRLALDKILTSRDRVIYIDCDTIALGDIAELWDIDMGDKPIAAVHDFIMESFCRTNVLSADFTGSLPASTYLREYLGLGESGYKQYFQAGVLVMNLRAIRELGVSDQMIAALRQRKYWFLDQDVLNKYFCGSQLQLPPEWNVITVIDEISGGLDPDTADRLRQAKNEAKLIHYAGYEAKPWVNDSAPLAPYYFHYLRRTFWYEDVMAQIRPTGRTAMHGGHSDNWKRHWQQQLRKAWRRLPFQARRMLNPTAYRVRRWISGD